MIKFSEPYRPKIPITDVYRVVTSEQLLVGGSHWSSKCEHLLRERYGLDNAILTSSCTDALEIAFGLANLTPNDNVLVPGFTFVSSVLPAIRYTNDISFCDVDLNSGVTTCEEVEAKMRPNTKVVVAVNYGGINHEIIKIRALCDKNGILLIEDAAQSIGAKINSLYYGSFGDFSTFSFHDTKNINSGGEGGCLVVNNKRFVERAHIMSEKGTNRRDFFNGSVKKYEWIDHGSSHIMSDLNAFILVHALFDEKNVTQHRSMLFDRYKNNLRDIGLRFGPIIHEGVQGNGHLIYVLLDDKLQRERFMSYLNSRDIKTSLHYPNLGRSPYARAYLPQTSLKNCDDFENTLCRLPLHNNMRREQVDTVCDEIANWLKEELK